MLEHSARHPGNSAVSIDISARGGSAIVESQGRFVDVLGVQGGSASAYADGRNAGTAPVFVRATAAGGRGGLSPDGAGGQGGEAKAEAYGESGGGGDVTVEAIQYGGSLGRRATGDVDKGHAARSVMKDAVSGSTSGLLTLRQEAHGGWGAKIGPDAAGVSILHARNPGGGALHATSLAIGSDPEEMTEARVVAYDESGSPIEAHAIAEGLQREMSGRNGGGARAWARGISSAGGDVLASARARAGSGNLEPSGVDVLLEDAVSGETAGRLTLVQEAVGGAPTFGSSQATIWAGGDATSLLSARNPLGGDLDVESIATAGGTMVLGLGDDLTLGGQALSEVDATSEAKSALSVASSAFGGAGGIGGDATSRVTAHSAGKGSVEVVSTATAGPAHRYRGISGRAESIARGRSERGPVSVRAVARGGPQSSPFLGDAPGNDSTSLGGEAVAAAHATGAQATAEAIASGRAYAIAGSEIRVEARSYAEGSGSLRVDAEVQPHALRITDRGSVSSTTIGGIHARPGELARAHVALDGRAVQHDIILRSEIQVDGGLVADASENLFVSFLDFDLLSNLFDEIQFAIFDEDGEALLDRRFEDEATARVFFDSAIDLASLLADEDSADFVIALAISGATGATRLESTIAIGQQAIPEPATVTMILFGLSILARTPQGGARAV